MATICKAIFEEICILANGEVVCSCGDPSGLKVHGSIYKESIAEIFAGNSYREMRRYQLDGKASSFCPVIGCNCGGRVYPALELHREKGLSIKRLQLEPISLCNLDCPECPVHFFETDSNYRRNRNGKLSLQTMVDVIQQLPDLEILWFYNFGEPFLHPQATEFLKEVRRIRPSVEIQCSTNGIPLTNSKISQIVEQQLVDHIVFSIDGVDQETYQKYRRKGSFEKAFQNMAFMRSEMQRFGKIDTINLRWQYILFSWNDSEEMIQQAKALSASSGIPIKWVLTHTEGKSERYTPDSQAYKNLVDSKRFYENLTCELQVEDLITNGSKGEYYSADINVENTGIDENEITFDVIVRNKSKGTWSVSEANPFRVGVYVIDKNGKQLEERHGAAIDGSMDVGQSREFSCRIRKLMPQDAAYLMIDMVHEHVCWFHQRGSTPFLMTLNLDDA